MTGITAWDLSLENFLDTLIYHLGQRLHHDVLEILSKFIKLSSWKKPCLDLNKDKSRSYQRDWDFGEDDDGVEDEGIVLVIRQFLSVLISEDMRIRMIHRRIKLLPDSVMMVIITNNHEINLPDFQLSWSASGRAEGERPKHELRTQSVSLESFSK
ncbi:hypothetical protein Tco_0950316 [Tanacetum coccineum]